jgi:asparagine synthase (glutamine-hydrolysing)
MSDGNRAALLRMNTAMAHRGPDAEGTWESPAGADGTGVLLGHRRLSILDLSAAGHQPMVDPVTGDVVALNGEIYNYVELRERLSSAGQRFQSTGDTAVMLRALGVHGREAVGWLRGMFAFAFWDHDRRELLLARDSLGIKPLYLARSREPGGEWSLAFASEVRALLASGLLPARRLHPHAAASMLWNGFVMGPDTAVDGVEALWPGQYRVYDPAGRELQAKRFWSVPAPGGAAPLDEAAVSSALEEGLRLHLASDVPLAVFLSGGVDSSAVANLAQRASRDAIHTFTLAFEEAAYDEGPAARRIAAAIGTEHQEVVLTEADFVAGLEPALDSLDQPTFDGLNAFFMSHVIRRAGFTVALVGTGGDELFGGYTSFRDLPRLQAWVNRIGWLPPGPVAAAARLLAAALQPASGSVPPQTRWAKLPDMVSRGHDLLALYQLAYALFLPDFQRQLLGAGADGLRSDGLPDRQRTRLLEETAGRSPLSAISVMEQRLFLGERLLRDNDAASMAASIEQRLPLVDQVLFEQVDRLPDAVRYDPIGRKSLLRRLGLKGLDPALFARPKSGFVLPYDRWIRQRLGTIMDHTMKDADAAGRVGLDPATVRRLWEAFLAGAPGIYWSRVWAVYVLIRWCHRNEVFR